MTNSILQADFGDASDDQLVPAVAAHGLTVNETVVLADGDGNRVSGTVSRIEGRLAWVLPAWPTWRVGVAVSVADGQTQQHTWRPAGASQVLDDHGSVTAGDAETKVLLPT